jgi:hypothetical protein
VLLLLLPLPLLPLALVLLCDVIMGASSSRMSR